MGRPDDHQGFWGDDAVPVARHAVYQHTYPSAAALVSSYSDSWNGSRYVQNGGNGYDSSLAFNDNNNLARSFVNPITGSMGAEVRTGGNTYSSAGTQSRFVDNFDCPQYIVSCATNMIGGLTASISINGSWSDYIEDYLDMGYLYQWKDHGGVKMYEFRFDLEADGNEAPSARATLWDYAQGTTVYDLDITSPTDGVNAISQTFTFDVVYETPVGPGPLSILQFSDFMQLKIDLDGDSNNEFIDFYDTFDVSISSLDPNLAFTSEGGRSVVYTAPPPPPQGIPEPGTFFLLAAGLLPVLRRMRH